MPPPDRVLKILHVDDDNTILEFAELFLAYLDSSMRFTNVATAREALGLLEGETYDCVLTDYRMPDMDGIQLARLIRQRSSIPIILYTG
jgi:CheY-like chemotaxis protein